MTPTFSVDLISDLNLSADDEFNWEGKPTSLFCVVAGGISNDLAVIKNVLEHLSAFYRGVMYIDGSLEHENLKDYEERVEEIRNICNPMTNVVYMHNHVVILNNVAFVCSNGWFNNRKQLDEVSDLIRMENTRIDDLSYVSKTIKSLQFHNDAHKIVVISSSVPMADLLFKPTDNDAKFEPALALMMDTEKKINVWLYGGTDVMVDREHMGIRYVNNPKASGQPYWPKRVLV